MEFECKRCGYTTNYKHSLIRHLKKQKACEIKSENICRDILISQLSNKDNDQDSERVTYKCLYCERKFRHKSSKSYHMSKCKSKDSNEQLIKRIEQLEREISSSKNKNNKTVYNNGNTISNVNNGTIVVNNIVLKNFGNENRDAIPLEVIRHTYMNLEYIKLFEELHCDPEYPENHNVRIKSLKNKLLEIYKDDKWKSLCLDDGLNEVLHQIYRIYKDFQRHHIDLIREDMTEEEIMENEEKLDELYALRKGTQCKLKEYKEIKNQFKASLETFRNSCSLLKDC
jgi:hypothetical protein